MAVRSRSTKTVELGVKSAGLASFVGLAKAISLVLGGIMVIVVARVIGPTSYGVYTLAISITSFGVAFGSVNMGPFYNRYIPKLNAEKKSDRAGVFVGDGLVFLAVLSILIMAIGLVLAPYISQVVFQSQSYIFYVYLSVVGISGAIIYPIVSTILVTVGADTEVMFSSVSQLATQAVLSVALVLMGFSAMGAIAAYVVGWFFGAILSIYYINRHAPIRFEWHGFSVRIREILGFSIPLTGAAIVIGVVSSFLAIYLVLLGIPNSQIGQYGLGTKISNVFDIAAGSISVVLIPMFATSIFSKQNKSKLASLYHNSIYYSVIFTLPMIVYAIVLSNSIIVTVFPAYTLAIIYMPLITIGTFINLLWGNAQHLLISMGKVSRIFLNTLIGGIVIMASLLILGPIFGTIGVIVGNFIIGQIAWMILYSNDLRKLRIHVKLAPLLKVILANLILGFVLVPCALLQIRPLYILIIGVIVSVLVYPVVLTKTKAVSEDDLDILNKVSERLPFGGGILRTIINYGAYFL